MTVMVYREFEPDEDEDRVLAVIREEYRVNPRRVRDVTGMRKQDVNEALQQLERVNWIKKVARGLYEFVEDPREQHEDNVTHSGDETQ